VVYAMLGNAAVAAVLALLALVVGCVCRSPTVRHAAWLIVLLTLVTPPLFKILVPVLPPSWEPKREFEIRSQNPHPQVEVRSEGGPASGSDFDFRISYFEFSWWCGWWVRLGGSSGKAARSRVSAAGFGARRRPRRRSPRPRSVSPRRSESLARPS